MIALSLNNVGHAYLGRTVLDQISLEIAAGEIVALVGPSGSGKSTLIHIAAGIVDPLRGQIKNKYHRQAMIFQEPRLLPWATAHDNIAYPLRISGLNRSKRDARVQAVAKRVALEPSDLIKFPSELSGGMRQRCAIARALVVDPDFVFFDEPFTALDVALKRRMQDLVIDAARAEHFGGIFVTHDLMEAARIAHRIAVLDVLGAGVVGERSVPGQPGEREDKEIFTQVQHWLHDDQLFRDIHNVDERKLA